MGQADGGSIGLHPSDNLMGMVERAGDTIQSIFMLR